MEKTAALIAKHEGLRLNPYECTAGKLTIGYGRNLDDVGISPAEALMFLQHDVESAYAACQQFDWFEELDAVRRAVVVNMLFNLGLPRFKKFKKSIALLAHGDYFAAGDEILNSRWADQVGARAQELSKMLKTGNWPVGLC